MKTGDRSEAALRPNEDRIKSGVSIWYEFIKLCYKQMHLFTSFIPVGGSSVEDPPAPVGRGTTEKAPVLDAMRDAIHAFETTPGHLWAAHLTDIPID